MLPRKRMAVGAGRKEMSSSLVASAMVRPSTYGHGNQGCFCPGAIFGFMKVSIRTYFAEPSGRANSTSLANGKPVHAIAMPQASTQR